MTLAIVATGPPGSGKSTTLTALRGGGITVVSEAATDVNLALLAAGHERPEQTPDFIARIVALQHERRLATRDPLQVHDRSVFCTLALATYLHLRVPHTLKAEVAAVCGVFAPRVLYFEPLGHIEKTTVRRINHDAAIEFGKVHREVYLANGFELIDVPRAAPAVRAEHVRALIRAWSTPRPGSS